MLNYLTVADNDAYELLSPADKKLLVFIDLEHYYRLDGVALPGVTTVMNPLNDWLKFVNKDVLKRAGEFGQNVHKSVELYLLDELDESSLDIPLAGCLDAFKSWESNEGADLLAQTWPILERPMAHKRLKYAGTPDMVFDALALIDVKSRPFSKATDPVQLVAYEELHKANGGAKVKHDHYVLTLNMDGTYIYHKANHKKAWGIFRKLLEYRDISHTLEQWKG